MWLYITQILFLDIICYFLIVDPVKALKIVTIPFKFSFFPYILISIRSENLKQYNCV